MSDVATLNTGGNGGGGFVGSLGRAIRVLYAPTRVFTELDRKPHWLVPIVICLIVGIAAQMILTPVVIRPQQREMLEERGMTEEQMQAARPYLEGPLRLVIDVGTLLIGIPLVLLVVAGVLHLVFGAMMGGQANFVRTFSVASFAWMVSLPESIVKVPIQLATKSMNVQTGLGLLMARDPSAGFGYRFAQGFLSHVDVFSVWRLVLIALGLSVMFKFPSQRCYYAVGGIWLVYIVLASILAAVLPGSMVMR